MKAKYIGAVAMLVLFGIVEPSNAQFGKYWDIGPGDMWVAGNLRGKETGVVFHYDFTFLLAENSDGFYPASEEIEIEVPGHLNPDGNESSALVISIPIGSFREGPSGIFYAWNPPGLKVRQRYKSYIWDFADSGGMRRESNGVKSFWAFMHKRSGSQANSTNITMLIRDNRYDFEMVEPAPKFLELLFGGPTLNFGDDGWRSYLAT